jgi:hypothetical protein
MLTLETLTDEQKEFLQDGKESQFDKELDIKILSVDIEWVEYGNKLYTKKFFHAGLTYECGYVFEVGPGTYDWDSDNASCEDCYLEVLPYNNLHTKEEPIKYHLVASTSLRGMGDVHITLKNVPDELHQRILEKYGSYWEMLEEGYVDEYEEYLNLPDVKIAETFAEENE